MALAILCPIIRYLTSAGWQMQLLILLMPAVGKYAQLALHDSLEHTISLVLQAGAAASLVICHTF